MKKKGVEENEGHMNWIYFIEKAQITSTVTYVAILLVLSYLLIPLGYSSFLIIFIIITLILALISGYSLFLSLKKNKKFIKLAIINLWSPYTLILALYFLTPKEVLEELGGVLNFIPYFIIILVLSVVWTLYLLKSKKVKDTFVN